MVAYCGACGNVKIMTFCPRCESRVMGTKGMNQVVCNKCNLEIKMCCCHR